MAPPSSSTTAATSSTTTDGAARQHSIRISSYFDRWRADWVQCIRDIFRDPLNGGPVRLAAWQEKAIRAAQDHDFLTIKAGRGVGKTAFLAVLPFPATIAYKKTNTIITATRKEQLTFANWKEMQLWLGMMDSAIRQDIKVLRSEIRIKGMPDNIIVATTGSKGSYESLQGLHSKRFTWIVDEAAGVDEAVFDTGIGSMTTKGSKIVLAGNPRLTSGTFYRTHTHRELAKVWHRLTVSAFDVRDEPYYNPQWIEDMRVLWGEDSWQWYAYVLGEFPPESEDAVIPMGAIQDAIYRNVVVPDGYKPIWGFDVAGPGADMCALAKRHFNVLLEPVDTWKAANTQDSVDRIVDEFTKVKGTSLEPAIIAVDVTGGMGRGPADSLRRIGIPVLYVDASSSASRQGIMNKRADLWLMGRDWFVGGGVHIPDDQYLVEELAAPKKMLGGTGNSVTKVQAKTEIRAMIGRSSDRADAFLLTLAGRAYEVDHVKRAMESGAQARMRRKREIAGTTWQAVC